MKNRMVEAMLRRMVEAANVLRDDIRALPEEQKQMLMGVELDMALTHLRLTAAEAENMTTYRRKNMTETGTAIQKAGEEIADALRATLISPNVADSNMEPANAVDVLQNIADAINGLARAVQRLGPPPNRA